MKVIIKGQSVDTKVLVINNDKNEIMITESEDGSFIVTKREDNEEVIAAYVKPEETNEKRPIMIMIKNVKGDGFSDACLWELNRSGVETGSVIKGVFDPVSNAVDFTSPNGDDCCAWVDSTCEILQTIPRHELKPGMVFFHGDHPENHVVLLKTYKESASMDHVQRKNDRPERYSMGYGWFDSYYYVRTMPDDEFNKYKLED